MKEQLFQHRQKIHEPAYDNLYSQQMKSSHSKESTLTKGGRGIVHYRKDPNNRIKRNFKNGAHTEVRQSRVIKEEEQSNYSSHKED